MMEKENLVVLVYARNTCHTTLVRLEDLKEKAEKMPFINLDDLEINLEEETWSYSLKDNHILGKFCQEWDLPIGEYRNGIDPSSNVRRGIIGVFDHTNFDHVRRLVSANLKALESRPNGYGLD